MSEKIPTAEELYYKYKGGNINISKKQFIEAVKYSNNLHVEAALQAAAAQALILEEELTGERDEENQPIVEKYSHSGGYIRDEHFVEVDKQSILNAYPKENIK